MKREANKAYYARWRAGLALTSALQIPINAAWDAIAGLQLHDSSSWSGYDTAQKAVQETSWQSE
jgi:hypothetical protein